MQLNKSPQSLVTLCLQFVSTASAPPPQKLFPLTSKPFELNLSYLVQRIYGSGEMYWMTFPWPWPKSRLWRCFCAIKWELLIGSLWNVTALLALAMVITCLDFGEVVLKTVILANFISGMVDPIDVKRKGSASVGYWAQYVTLTFDLTHDLDLGCFKVKFQNSSFSRTTLPFDHTHDFDIGVKISRSESEIALAQEWGGRLTMNEKYVSHPFMTMILTSVAMVGWAVVPDSD